MQLNTEHKVVVKGEPMIRLGNPFDDPVGSGPDTKGLLPQG